MFGDEEMMAITNDVLWLINNFPKQFIESTLCLIIHARLTSTKLNASSDILFSPACAAAKIMCPGAELCFSSPHF